MKMPWVNKMGLAKAAAVLATMFLVSLGVCGVNFGSKVVLGTMKSPALREHAASVWIFLGLAGTAGIVLSVFGLIVVGALAAVMEVSKKTPKGGA